MDKDTITIKIVDDKNLVEFYKSIKKALQKATKGREELVVKEYSLKGNILTISVATK